MALGMEEDRTCWICLCGPDGLDTGEDDQVVRVCACPRVCHKRCLGRWQLQNAGKREEKYCRFCQQRYPDWRSSLTPGEITPSTPVMAVSVRGKVYKLRVRAGPEGKEDFKRQIRQLLGFTQDMDFDVIFECKTPHNGAEKVQLHGFEAFEAASWCAAVSAAKRKKAKQEAAARAAAAAAAAAAAGGQLTPTASCPAALTLPDSRPSSSGSTTALAGSTTSSDGGCDVQGAGRDTAVLEPAVGLQHDAHTSIAPSAFATATATATAALSGCPAGAQPLSAPHPDVHSLTSGAHNFTTGLYDPVPATSAMLRPTGHGIVMSDDGAASAAATDGSSTRGSPDHSRAGSSTRSTSCPGCDRSNASPAAPPRAPYSSSLQPAMSVPAGSSGGVYGAGRRASSPDDSDDGARVTGGAVWGAG